MPPSLRSFRVALGIILRLILECILSHLPHRVDSILVLAHPITDPE